MIDGAGGVLQHVAVKIRAGIPLKDGGVAIIGAGGAFFFGNLFPDRPENPLIFLDVLSGEESLTGNGGRPYPDPNCHGGIMLTCDESLPSLA